ncbi:hypothetical protein C8R45DRAFT_923088 [Mycena sanguinolenta]|nr:hypothetical protein C8R45DRAFT_923088 [Mycena sanguinolenta]
MFLPLPALDTVTGLLIKLGGQMHSHWDLGQLPSVHARNPSEYFVPLLAMLVTFALVVDSVSLVGDYICIYEYTITHAGDLEYLATVHWPIPLYGFTTGVLGTLVQAFLLFRYWRFTQKTAIAILLALVIIISFGSVLTVSLMLTLYTSLEDRQIFQIPMPFWLVTEVVVDASITSVLLWELRKAKGILIPTPSALDRLTAVTIQSGAAAATLAGGALIAAVVNLDSQQDDHPNDLEKPSSKRLYNDWPNEIEMAANNYSPDVVRCSETLSEAENITELSVETERLRQIIFHDVLTDYVCRVQDSHIATFNADDRVCAYPGLNESEPKERLERGVAPDKHRTIDFVAATSRTEGRPMWDAFNTGTERVRRSVVERLCGGANELVRAHWGQRRCLVLTSIQKSGRTTRCVVARAYSSKQEHVVAAERQRRVKMLHQNNEACAHRDEGILPEESPSSVTNKRKTVPLNKKSCTRGMVDDLRCLIRKRGELCELARDGQQYPQVKVSGREGAEVGAMRSDRTLCEQKNQHRENEEAAGRNHRPWTLDIRASRPWRGCQRDDQQRLTRRDAYSRLRRTGAARGCSCVVAVVGRRTAAAAGKVLNAPPQFPATLLMNEGKQCVREHVKAYGLRRRVEWLRRTDTDTAATLMNLAESNRLAMRTAATRGGGSEQAVELGGSQMAALWATASRAAAALRAFSRRDGGGSELAAEQEVKRRTGERKPRWKASDTSHSGKPACADSTAGSGGIE